MNSEYAPRVLLLFAHPLFERSRVHRRLIQVAEVIDGITIHDLYEEYPDYDIDIQREQELLMQHDVLVVQCPFYWYSTPPIVKQWEDLVLEHGWAYGSTGKALLGKCWLQVVTAGGGENAYSPGGRNRMTVQQLLAPLENTALLCNMKWLEPHVIHGTHAMTESDFKRVADMYRARLEEVVRTPAANLR